MKRKKKKRNRTEMGICWSEPPLPPATQVPVVTSNQPCRGCGSWQKQPRIEYCEICLQKNAMKYVTPSAPPYSTQPMYPQTPQYTYAVPYQQQQQMQMYSYYQPRPPMYPPQQQQQMGTGTAMLGGFLLGAVAEDILDPMD
jgi:hypothetical protein